jgi:hypothetical protein
MRGFINWHNFAIYHAANDLKLSIAMNKYHPRQQG